MRRFITHSHTPITCKAKAGKKSATYRKEAGCKLLYWKNQDTNFFFFFRSLVLSNDASSKNKDSPSRRFFFGGGLKFAFSVPNGQLSIWIVAITVATQKTTFYTVRHDIKKKAVPENYCERPYHHHTSWNLSFPLPFQFFSAFESSHGRGAAIFAELLKWGAQHLTRNITSKKFVRATRPTLLCTSPKTIILVKLSQ